MLIADLKQYILDVSGELVDDYATKFANAVVRALSMYNRYVPHTVSTTQLAYDNQIQMDGPPYPKQVSVSSVQDIGDKILYPNDVICEYDATTGIVTVNPLGAYRITGYYNWALTDLDETHIDFLDLVLAYFKQGVGSKRKSFQLQGLPFDSDAQSRYDEGKALEDTVIERLQADAPTWKGII